VAKLHDNNIIHGDLTTSNIFLKFEENREKFSSSQNDQINSNNNISPY
jgi:serine/threonine protein kinase